MWVLIEYASWCCEEEDNLACTISVKLAAFSTFIGWRRMCNSLPQHQCLRARSKALLGATLRQGRRQVRLLVSWRMLLEGGGAHPLLGCRGKGDVALFMSELFPDCPVG